MTRPLPCDYGLDAQKKADNCPFVLDEATTGCTLTPGTVVYGRNTGIETIFPPGQVVRLVLFGFTRPHGYACCLDREGTWWNVHPESLIEEADLHTVTCCDLCGTVLPDPQFVFNGFCQSCYLKGASHGE